MRGEMNEVAAVQEGNHGHSGWKQSQTLIGTFAIELRDLVMDLHQRGVGFRALAEQHDAGDYVVVVDDFSVRQVPSARELAEPHLGPLRHYGDIPHA